MKILMGIIAFHMLVILRTHYSEKEGIPWGSTLLLSLLLTGFVLYMLFAMEEPTL